MYNRYSVTLYNQKEETSIQGIGPTRLSALEDALWLSGSLFSSEYPWNDTFDSMISGPFGESDHCYHGDPRGFGIEWRKI